MTDFEPQFTVVLRGYDVRAVDDWIDQLRAGGTAPARFRVVLRGYDTAQVDRYVEQVSRR
ncbi:DivIVA domain-containing protein [Actinocatenispora thailandica]|nr:DivIVA domain-containing protein [Actinocatenispora thailandica]